MRWYLNINWGSPQRLRFWVKPPCARCGILIYKSRCAHARRGELKTLAPSEERQKLHLSSASRCARPPLCNSLHTHPQLSFFFRGGRGRGGEPELHTRYRVPVFPVAIIFSKLSHGRIRRPPRRSLSTNSEAAGTNPIHFHMFFLRPFRGCRYQSRRKVGHRRSGAFALRRQAPRSPNSYPPAESSHSDGLQDPICPRLRRSPSHQNAGC